MSLITDASNDLYLDSLGNIAYDTGLESYRQQIINEIRLQQFEYRYDLSRGLNYMGYILGDTVNFEAWEAQLFDALKRFSFVTGISEWTYNVENNTFKFVLIVTTDLGDIEIKG